MYSNKDYKLKCDSLSPKTSIIRNSFTAFTVGGGICFLGEIIASVLMRFDLTEKNAYLSVTLIFIVLASIVTSLGFFDRIASAAGAGTLVPVTGFSNAVTSSAIDTRSEGFIAGVGTKIFTVAGPVILYATLFGTAYGLIYYLYSLFV